MTFLAILGGAVGIFALLVISSLLRGFVLVKIWGWFIVPLFHLPVLTLLPAIGLALVVGFMTYQYQYSKDERCGSTWRGDSGERDLSGVVEARRAAVESLRGGVDVERGAGPS